MRGFTLHEMLVGIVVFGVGGFITVCILKILYNAAFGG